MKFYALAEKEGNTNRTNNAPDTPSEETLRAEYKAAQEIGKIRLGEKRFYLRSARKVYYISYSDIYRYFRRVMLVPARMCCGRGDFAVEYLVICDSDRELAQIQLPGSHAAKVLMERMLTLAPAAVVGSPDSTSGNAGENTRRREDNIT